MPTLRDFLDRQRAAYFDPGRPLERLRSLYQAADEALYTPGLVTRGAPHVRDSANHQRVTGIVLAALGPIVLWAMYNTGHQAAVASEAGASFAGLWQARVFNAMGWSHDPASVMGCFLFGALMYVPVAIIAILVAGGLDILFARQRAPHGDFLVIAAVFSLILPTDTPLWRVALGMSIGDLLSNRLPFDRHVSRRLLHPAVVGCYVTWILFEKNVSGILGPYGDAWADLWWTSFVGPDTPSTAAGVFMLLCLLCAAALVATGVRSWRPMAGCATAALGFALADAVLWPGAELPLWQRMTTGTFMFATVFITTDPLSSPFTNRGRLLYGFCYGSLVALIGLFTWFDAEGPLVSLAFLNLLVLGFDAFVVHMNLRRRQVRYAKKKG